MTRSLAAFGLRLVAVTGSALILQFFSEFYFLNEGPARNAARGWAAFPELMISIYVYGLFAYLFLIVLDRFAVRSLAGLLLAGSIFGWATEALVVPVVYEAPPVSFLWPSVGWHALIDVIAGWYLLRLAMRRLAWPFLALLFAALGVVWAFWATWTWSATEEPPAVYSVAEFWTIVLGTGASWIIGTVLADIAARYPFRASIWEVLAIGLFALVMFGAMGVSFLPWSAMLALGIALTFGALAWARRGRGRNRLAPLGSPAPLAAYFAMPLLPLAAGSAYPLVLDASVAVPTSEITPLLFLLGAVGYLWALVRSALDGRTS